jgi:hypothetical protein
MVSDEIMMQLYLGMLRAKIVQHKQSWELRRPPLFEFPFRVVAAVSPSNSFERGAMAKGWQKSKSAPRRMQ